MKKTFSLTTGLLAAAVLAVALMSVPHAARADVCTCKGGGGNGEGAVNADATTAEQCDAFCGSMGGTAIEPSASGATTPGTSASGSATPLENPLSGVCSGKEGPQCVQLVIGNVIKWAFGIVGSIALLMMIWGGFLWLTSMGNSDKVERGKSTLIWATIGLAVIFGAYTLTSFVVNALTTPPKTSGGSSGPVQNTTTTNPQEAPGTPPSNIIPCATNQDCNEHGSGTCKLLDAGVGYCE